MSDVKPNKARPVKLDNLCYDKIDCNIIAFREANHRGEESVSIFIDGAIKIENEYMEEVEKLQAENEELRKCVEFYANTLSWQHIPCETRHNWFRPIISPEQDCSQVNTDEWCSYGGKLARQTLKELKRGKDE